MAADTRSTQVPAEKNIGKREDSGSSLGWVVSIADQVVVCAWNFLMTWLLARYFDKSFVGLYFLGFGFFAIAESIQMALVTSPYGVLRHKKPAGELPSYEGSCLVQYLAVAAFSSAASCMLSIAFYLGIGDSAMAPVMGVMCFTVPLMLLHRYVRFSAFARFQPHFALLVDLLASGVSLGIVAFLVASQDLTVAWAFASRGVGCLVGIVIWAIAFRPKSVCIRELVRRHFSEHWRFARWELPARSLRSLGLYISPWILVAFHTTAETGVLAVCMSIIGITRPLMLVVAVQLAPYAAAALNRGGLSEFKRVLTIGSGIFVLVLGPFPVLSYFYADRVAEMIFHSSYVGIGAIVTILAVGQLMASLRVVTEKGVLVLEQPRLNFTVEVTTIVALLLGSALLIPRYGVVGLAVATAISSAVGAIHSWWSLQMALASFPRRTVIEEGN